MSQKKPEFSLKPFIRTNKKFIYLGKKYPIDFDLIKKNSNYFFEKRDQYDEIQDILLFEETMNISEDSIRCFISACHNESFDINDSNVFSLHQLSIRYDVPCLHSLTDEYIKAHDKTLIFQSIQYKLSLQKQNFNKTMKSISLESDEQSIASNFFDFINDEQLLNLPVQVLYRIINDPKLNINNLNETAKNQLIDFLFKCLKKYKKEASVLFLNLDIENQRIELFSKLINEYSDVFDFSMINPKFLMKTTTDLLSELNQIKLDYSNSISQFNQILNQIKEEKQTQLDLFKQSTKEQLIKECENLNDAFKNLKKQFDDEKQSTQKQLRSNEDKLKSIEEDLEKKYVELKFIIEKEKEDNKKLSNENIIDCPEGVFSYLFKKTNSNPVNSGLLNISGNSYDSGNDKRLHKIVESNNSSFWGSKDVPNSSFKIEFVNSLVKIDTYKLRVGAGSDDYSFKSWTLKGTTEDNREIVLDDVDNSQEITKDHQEATRYTRTKVFVRSIQLIMKGKCSDGRDLMEIQSIEVFGSLKTL